MNEMHYDVYLGGVTAPEWRTEFKSQISSDISVFDPYLEGFQAFSNNDKAEQIAREFYFMDQCDIVVFYFNSTTAKSARLQLGDAVGADKQVVVCIDGSVKGKTFIIRYCEYRGIPITENVEELVTTVEEYAAEVELCQFDTDE